MRLSASAVAIVLLLAAVAAAEQAPRPTVDRFDEHRAFAFLERQVRLGPRPAGSAASRTLAAILRAELPSARYQPVPGGLRNVVARVPGRNPRRTVVIGAHYDTKELPGFVGANDGASGTAVALELARTVRPRSVTPSLVFVFFDGEESPGDKTDITRFGLRGSKVAARVFRGAEAMILLDFVGDRELSLPREANSDLALWARLRRAARRVGVADVFPPRSSGGVVDDHLPFLRRGVPSVDLIDFDFPCWHLTCDDLSAVSARSLDAVGEALVELLYSY
jgi:glutaminyl-peptide cyclotransferase